MTLSYLIDTDWVIDHFNRLERTTAKLKDLAGSHWRTAPDSPIPTRSFRRKPESSASEILDPGLRRGDDFGCCLMPSVCGGTSWQRAGLVPVVGGFAESAAHTGIDSLTRRGRGRRRR